VQLYCPTYVSPFWPQRIEDQLGEVRLREDSLQILQLLQELCTELETLETLNYGQDFTGLIKEDKINTKFVREVLLETNAQFRGISSPDKIIVRVYSGAPASSAREFLEGLGWVVLLGDG
jgi:hypothetical protein